MGADYRCGECGFSGNLVSNNEIALNDLRPGDVIEVHGMLPSFQGTPTPYVLAFMDNMIQVGREYEVNIVFLS